MCCRRRLAGGGTRGHHGLIWDTHGKKEAIRSRRLTHMSWLGHGRGPEGITVRGLKEEGASSPPHFGNERESATAVKIAVPLQLSEWSLLGRARGKGRREPGPVGRIVFRGRRRHDPLVARCTVDQPEGRVLQTKRQTVDGQTGEKTRRHTPDGPKAIGPSTTRDTTTAVLLPSVPPGGSRSRIVYGCSCRASVPWAQVRRA